MKEFYDTEGFNETMDVSASNRKFQTSIVVRQDPTKSGIISFLSSVSEQNAQPQSTPPSNNSSNSQGNYP